MVESKIKIMVVDDSLSIRLLLKGIFADQPDMEVIATAADPMQAIEELKNVQPDVVTLDVEMPHMDGITFLQKLMKLRPMPVVMISTLTARGSETAIKALEEGAVEVVGKPSAQAKDLEQRTGEIVDKVRAAAFAKVKGKKSRLSLEHQNAMKPQAAVSVDAVLAKNAGVISRSNEPIIAIGSSTGGPQALQQILTSLNGNLPGVVIVQHMASGFTAPFAKRLDGLCKLKIYEAEDGMPIEHGCVYIAPAGKHLAVVVGKNGLHYACHIFAAEPVNRHCPAVDVLFRSVADIAGSSAMGIILTGMGDDGARGLLEMRESGAYTVAQNEDSCIVYGMPRVAVSMNAATKILSLDVMAGAMKAFAFSDKNISTQKTGGL